MGSSWTTRPAASRKMEARDFIQLAALGTAGRGPAGVEDIQSALQDIVGFLWTPVSEVVAGCVEDLLLSGDLALADSRRGEAVLSLTDNGRQRLGGLLAQPTDCPASPLGQVGLRLKLAFIDLVSDADRRNHLDNIICVYERELADWTRRCASCPRQGALGRMWLDLQSDRLQQEVQLLRRMADRGNVFRPQ